MDPPFKWDVYSDAILPSLDGQGYWVHTEMCSNGIIDLLENGIVTNCFKKKHPGGHQFRVRHQAFVRLRP